MGRKIDPAQFDNLCGKWNVDLKNDTYERIVNLMWYEPWDADGIDPLGSNSVE